MTPELSSQVQRMFADLNQQSVANAIPMPGSLATLLSKHVVASSPTTIVAAQQKELTFFATAAVEMWLRSVHSFLISVSLTKASPIWASVAGYYSSHYSIRAFAHLFGVFHLHRKKRIVRLEKQANHLVFRIEKKLGNDREHKFYWRCVTEHHQLASDPFFYTNQDDAPRSDGAHRNKANYVDHIDRFPVFLPLEAQYLKDRVERISNIEFSDVPVPSADDFPDIDNVQVIAYHRLVKFRRFVDETVGAKNRFWKVQRNPSWCPDTLNFSVVDPVFAALYAGK
jgi:hypothetical protein